MIYAQQAWRRRVQYIPRSPSWNLKRPEFRNQRVSYMYGRSALLNTHGTYPEGKQRLYNVSFRAYLRFIWKSYMNVYKTLLRRM